VSESSADDSLFSCISSCCFRSDDNTIGLWFPLEKQKTLERTDMVNCSDSDDNILGLWFSLEKKKTLQRTDMPTNTTSPPAIVPPTIAPTYFSTVLDGEFIAATMTVLAFPGALHVLQQVMLSRLLVKSVMLHNPPFAGGAIDPHR
jgi:hypothetical protein